MRRLVLAIMILIPIFLYSGQTSIFDIQYCTNSGTDGTFPSPFRNQIVTTSGIVTATGYRNGGLYISEPVGGPWRGIYVDDRNREVRIGDMIEITGEVIEQFGFTTISNVRRLRVISTGNALPVPVLVTTGELSVSEAYEGVLVRLSNVTVTNRSDQGELWMINDGTGIGRMGEGFQNGLTSGLSVNTGYVFSHIIGIVDYRFGEYRINPRNNSDLQSTPVGTNRPSWGRIKSLYR